MTKTFLFYILNKGLSCAQRNNLRLARRTVERPDAKVIVRILLQIMQKVARLFCFLWGKNV